ncbi:SAM-dependent methyltransferase [Demetria terragena]|uniref:SAM-dependent methyltransferase n=1 Tax=Demetria terragena TaxID=63959 RepID=UPI000371BF23|nr:SAM-dependent methyltransferase [Demetria terragena]
MPSAVTFSVAPDFYRHAVSEIRLALPVSVVRRLGEDAGVVELRTGPEDASAQHRLANAVRANEVQFVRHLAAADAQTKTSALRGGPEVAVDWVLDAVLDQIEPGDEISLHVWDSGQSPYAPGKVRRPLLEALMDAGARIVTSGAPSTVSVCLGEERSTAGVGPSQDGLIDWAGGRIRLASRPDQISRAGFKLEELFSLIGTPTGTTAIDLGASPGGWTRVLRDIGFSDVITVDPADLDPRLADDPGVRHHRTTAGEFLHASAGSQTPVDLIVNDMRMVPHLSAATMVEAADLLTVGGLGVVTFKIGTSNPIKQADESLETLSEAYDIEFVRQLQHNRSELTVVARRS